MKTINVFERLLAVYTLALILALTGCGKNIELPSLEVPTVSGATTKLPGTNAPSAVIDPGTQVEGPGSDPAVTVYSLQVLLYLHNGVTPVYGTGYCAVYESNTYCWDDGLHGTSGAGNTVFDADQSGLNFCRGNCQDDTFATPVLVTANVQAFDDRDVQTVNKPSFNTILTTGTATTVNCTLDNDLNPVCPTFTIDINQSPL